MAKIQDIIAGPLPPDLRGMRVTVLGLARSGAAAARLLRDAGCRVFASDSAQNDEIRRLAAELNAAGIETEFGGHSPRALDCDFLVRSPGVPDSNPILTKARASGLFIAAEIEVAAWFCRAPLIAVTGSNGKTTTTEWIGDVFRRAEKHAAVCGNVGFPFSAAAAGLRNGDAAVVEVSSFQLEDIHRFQPDIAVITNFSPDHLDRHATYDAYLRAKCRIFENQTGEDVLVYNRGDAEVSRRIRRARARRLSFGTDEPQGDGAGVIRGRIAISLQGETKMLIPAPQLSLPGAHNLENALAMVCAAAVSGLEDAAIQASLTQFPGVPHRLERVLEKDGILWIEDSKATNISSGLTALRSFDRPLILLAGGRDKGGDFAAAAAEVASRVRSVITFGEAGPLIARAWSHALKPIETGGLEEAVRTAAALARSGDIVLLSPMCASFDEFKNYEDRGEKFKMWVRQYA
jgi:UDP-N-acetylmuramoylalanine--D-glutamate ligase